MNIRLKYLLIPFVLAIVPAIARSQTTTPAPANEVQFSIPLTDGKTATAVLLPAPNDATYLVYATPDGKIGLYLLTKSEPQPDPNPPDPIPPDPTPQKLTIAIVENPETSTQNQRSILSNPEWRKIAKEKHNFKGIIPIDLIDKRTGLPPEDLAPFIDEANSHILPCLVLTTKEGKILWAGQLPDSVEALKSIIYKYGGK